MSEKVKGADGFQWEHNRRRDNRPLAGSAKEEWFREVENKSDELWRVTTETGEQGFLLRRWSKGADDGLGRLLNSEYAPQNTLSRAQELAQVQETPDEDPNAGFMEGGSSPMPRW